MRHTKISFLAVDRSYLRKTERYFKVYRDSKTLISPVLSMKRFFKSIQIIVVKISERTINWEVTIEKKWRLLLK